MINIGIAGVVRGVAGVAGEAANRAMVESLMYDGIGLTAAIYYRRYVRGQSIQLPIQHVARSIARNIATAFTPYLVRETVKGLVLSSGMPFPACALIIVATSALAGAYKGYSRYRHQRTDIIAGTVIGAAKGLLCSVADLAGLDSNIMGCVISYSGIQVTCNYGLRKLGYRVMPFNQSLVSSAILGLSRQGFAAAGSMVMSMTSMPLAPLVGAMAVSSLLAYNLYLCDTQEQRSSKGLMALSAPLLSVSVMATAAGVPLLPVAGGAYTLALVALALENYNRIPTPSEAKRAVAARIAEGNEEEKRGR